MYTQNIQNHFSEIKLSLKEAFTNNQCDSFINTMILTLNVLKHNYQFQDEIQESIIHQRVEVLKFIYEKTGNLREEHLLTAILVDSIEILKLILKRAPSIVNHRFNDIDWYNPCRQIKKTALTVAIESGKEKCAHLLLDAGASFEVAAKTRLFNSTRYMIDYKMIGLLKRLLALKCVVLKPADFHYAIEKCNKDMICFCLGNCVPLYSSFYGRQTLEAKVFEDDQPLKIIIENYPYIRNDQLPQYPEFDEVIFVEPSI